MIVDLILFVKKVYQFFDLIKLNIYWEKMKKQIIGWIIVASALIWGILRWIDLVESNFVINFFAIGGFCFGVYLTKDPNEEDNEFKSNN